MVAVSGAACLATVVRANSGLRAHQEFCSNFVGPTHLGLKVLGELNCCGGRQRIRLLGTSVG